MIEKSNSLLYYQNMLVKCREDGDRTNVPHFLRCAASYRQRDMAPPPYETDWSEGTRDLQRTRYVNG